MRHKIISIKPFLSTGTKHNTGTRHNTGTKHKTITLTAEDGEERQVTFRFVDCEVGDIVNYVEQPFIVIIGGKKEHFKKKLLLCPVTGSIVAS